mmetsp:Transcript_74871/g.67301  ORF Transcript_74871/g.67301 Transcript_74871/m.67301 type:complete len:134 (+) Transcript_74871:99-500(+)|eukprot:CAMPEP_0201570294 /NCGR_PEP_ID=MMETSP0190_2-20130828/12500_1 /ASSEMBLY_ACC=CAM_ASM_000263 /TAXON_ID=37353 /ORGANISM="Rosalina sp." /LENGTH=133 /DNA_ID=CAMNT_0047993695 /DNA_START=78 /DNA_END=479 /DNA_ORIENTATION=-
MLAVTASEQCLERFEDLKMSKKIAYQIYAIDGKEIKCEEEVKKADAGDQKEYAEKFIAALKEKGVRYGCIDYNGKIAFVAWSPDTGKAANKMKYASSKEGFVTSLVGVYTKIQATDDGELTVDILEEKCKKKV